MIFHNKQLSKTARQKNIKTCHKNCTILKANIKIHSKTIADRNNLNVYNEWCLLTCDFSTIVIQTTPSAHNT